MPTADELISPASIRDLARVLHQASLASQWDTRAGGSRPAGPLGLSDRARAVAAAITSDEPGSYQALADVIRAALRDPGGDPGSFTVTGPAVATPRLRVGEDLIFAATVANTSAETGMHEMNPARQKKSR